VIIDNLEDLEEIVEDNLPLRKGYEWVDHLVRKYFSKLKWSKLLNYGVQSIYVFESEKVEHTMSFSRVCAIDNVCQG